MCNQINYHKHAKSKGKIRYQNGIEYL